MEEQAKKELEMLEAQYPNQFEYLKQELRSFIIQQQDSLSLLFPQNDNHVNAAANVFLDTEGFFSSTSLILSCFAQLIIDVDFLFFEMFCVMQNLPVWSIQRRVTVG